MQIVENRIERVARGILVGIGLVVLGIEADVELEGGVIGCGKISQAGGCDSGGAFDEGEPVLARDPIARRLVVAPAEKTGIGEEIGESGEVDLLTGPGGQFLAGKREGFALPEVVDLQRDSRIGGSDEGEHAGEKAKAPKHEEEG